MSDYYQQESQMNFGFGGITHAVQRIMLVTIGIFVLQLAVDIPMGDRFVNDTPGGWPIMTFGAFSTSAFLGGYVWQPVSYMFLHAGLYHLFGNMLMLYIFGPSLERLLGTRQFIWFYFLCGAIGVLANLVPIFLFNTSTSIVIVGASGAVLGVLVAFAVIEPDRKIFIIPIPFPITIRALVIFLVFINLLSAVGGGTGTSVATHFGGMITGFCYMKYRPLLNRWRWRTHGRARKATSEDENSEDHEKLGDAIDNIFEFRNKDDK